MTPDHAAAHWGLSYREYVAMVDAFGNTSSNRSPLKKYQRHKENAHRRAVPWLFTFREWWDVWQRSGKWEQRSTTGYVMARVGDAGPYAPWNVYICHCRQNVRDAHRNGRHESTYNSHKRTQRPERGVRVVASKNRGLRYKALYRNKHLGVFNTLEEARAVVEAARAQ